MLETFIFPWNHILSEQDHVVEYNVSRTNLIIFMSDRPISCNIWDKERIGVEMLGWVHPVFCYFSLKATLVFVPKFLPEPYCSVIRYNSSSTWMGSVWKYYYSYTALSDTYSYLFWIFCDPFVYLLNSHYSLSHVKGMLAITYFMTLFVETLTKT